AAGRREREAAVERALEIGLDDDARLVEPAVLEAERELGRPPTARDERVEPGEERLEVDVPDPRDVAPVRDLVVQRDHTHPRRPAVDERADRFVRAGRVLDQEQKEPLVVDGDALEAAEGGAEAREARDDLVESRAEG